MSILETTNIEFFW